MSGGWVNNWIIGWGACSLTLKAMTKAISLIRIESLVVGSDYFWI